MARMTVKEFATARGRTTQGVYQLIRRHQKEIKKHLRTQGGVMVIDEEGQALLDQWNGRPKDSTLAIIEAPDINLRQELEEAKDKILRLTEEKADLQAEIIRLQQRVAGLLEANGALQVQLLEARTPEPATDPEGPEAKTEPEAEGSHEEKREDPEELRSEKRQDPEDGQGGKIEKPEEEPKPEKRKGFFARLFGF